VVLAAATYAEQGGTTTNIEGRVSRLAQKVTPPGTARPDWMIAAELAALLGGDLGVTSHQAICAEISDVVPTHLGIDAALAVPDAGRLGVVVPLASPPAGDDPLPEPITWDVPAPSEVAAPANYALRLAVGRKLYDQATSVAMSPSLAGLAPEAVLRLHPGDVDRLGIAAGERVQVEARGGRTLVVPCRPDPGVPRGVAALGYLQPGAVTAELLDAGQRFVEVRVDTRAAGRSAGG
jgi:predicted molibdopterin-dependent oxidoreductase YjgC